MYPQTMNLNHDAYPTHKAYLEAYQECCKHYGFKVRVEGGWKFFDFVTDLLIWKNQR